MLDVILVCDFSGTHGDHPRDRPERTFVGRALLFLGSWLENAGAARSWPLHLVCIGEPPDSVRALARECGASIAVRDAIDHEYPIPVFNKRRGFEVQPRTDRFLLLDADIVVYSDPTPIADLGQCIAVSPIFRNRCPLERWVDIYRELERPLPTRRMMTAWGANGLRAPRARYPEDQPVPPFFNGGVVMAPWELEFDTLWSHYTDRLIELFYDRSEEWTTIVTSDQPGLALAVEEMRTRGVRVRRHPHGVNAWIPHYVGGGLTVEETILFHAVGIFGMSVSGTLSYAAEVQLYRGIPSRFEAMAKVAGIQISVTELRGILEKTLELVERYVEPVLA